MGKLIVLHCRFGKTFKLYSLENNIFFYTQSPLLITFSKQCTPSISKILLPASSQMKSCVLKYYTVLECVHPLSSLRFVIFC
jgi:hypothetical protein